MTTLRKMIFACLCFAFLIHCGSGSDQEIIHFPSCDKGHAPGEVLVGFNTSEFTESEAQNILNEYGITEYDFRDYNFLNDGAIVYVDEGTEMDWIQRFEDDERFSYAELNNIVCLE